MKTTLRFWRISTFAAVLFLSFLTPLHADLDDFKNDIEQAEADHYDQDDNQGSNSEHNSPFFSLFVEVFKLVWAINNLNATYADYPYADGYLPEGKFVYLPSWQVDPERGIVADTPATDENHWFEAGMQGFYLDGIGSGTGFVFRGHLWRFIGPYFEGMMIAEDAGDTRWARNLRLGGTLALFQTNPLSMNVFIQWQGWDGYIDRSNGMVLGAEIQSFPFKPLSLRGRAMISMFDSFSMEEYELKAGAFYGPWEFWGGWRWWNLVSLDGDRYNSYNGLMAGASYWF